MSTSDPYSDRGNKDLSLGDGSKIGTAQPVKPGGKAFKAQGEIGRAHV